VAHGQALAIVYPAFAAFTADAAPARFAWLARQLDPSLHGAADAVAAARSASLINDFIVRIGISDKLSNVGVPRDELDSLAAACMVLSDYKNNPRVATAEEMRALVLRSW
jgi:alcohol dehydrogenase class IV